MSDQGETADRGGAAALSKVADDILGEELRGLSPERQAAALSSIAQHHRLAQDLEDTRRALAAAKITISGVTAQNEEMRREIDYANERVKAAHAERDSAIAERAQLEALFSLIQRVCNDAELPAALLETRRTGKPVTLTAQVAPPVPLPSEQFRQDRAEPIKATDRVAE
jgi:hypothetical protein